MRLKNGLVQHLVRKLGARTSSLSFVPAEFREAEVRTEPIGGGSLGQEGQH